MTGSAAGPIGLEGTPRPGLFDRLYARTGDRYLFLLLAGGALSIAAAAPVAASLAIPYLGLSFSEYARALVIVVPLIAVVGLCVELRMFQVLAPVRGWMRAGRPSSMAPEAWTAALVAVPRAVIVNGLAAIVGVIPAVVYVVSVTGELTPLLALGAIVGIGIFVLAVIALHFLVWEQGLRPIVLEIATQLPPDFDVRHDSISLSAKLISVIPVVNVMTAFGAIGAGGEDLAPGARVALALGVAAGVSVIVALPLALMLRRSLLSPMDRLLAAMGRVERGDLEARLPYLSADELATIARHFNDMLEGLKERERLSGENVRLEAKVREQLEEVLASRARIIAASDAERRRVERNLHDGAQQRLVALALELRLLQQRVADAPRDELERQISQASDNLSEALGELKELARGLHPQILTTDGLRPALTQLAARAPVPVDVDVEPGRFPESVESTAYFVVSEALANVAKYAEATSASVSLERRNGRLAIEVSDDGVGGADPAAGSGLAGLTDRVAALDGTLEVTSPAGVGTTVKAELPLDGAARS